MKITIFLIPIYPLENYDNDLVSEGCQTEFVHTKHQYITLGLMRPFPNLKRWIPKFLVTTANHFGPDDF